VRFDLRFAHHCCSKWFDVVRLELYVEKPFLGKQTWNVVKVFDLEIVMGKWRNSPSLGTRGPNGVGIVRAWLSRGSPDSRVHSRPIRHHHHRRLWTQANASMSASLATCIITYTYYLHSESASSSSVGIAR